jgi:hypothetical protein
LPSIDQIMPWLHLVFDAWEDYRQTRLREAQERDAQAAVDAALREAEPADAEDDSDDEDDGKDDKKKKKHRKHKK